MVSRREVVAFLLGVGIPAACFVLASGRRQHDRTLLYYGGYLLAMIGVFLVQTLTGTGGRRPPTEGMCWACWLVDALQLPYAWFYLRFVRHYFRLETWSPWGAMFWRWLEWAYVVPVAALALRAFGGPDVESWPILFLNLINLLGSYVLALQAWRRRREGAGWFLLAVCPLALGGILLATQWVVDRGGSSINGLFPFWVGLVLQQIFFLVALGVRYRRVEQRLREVETARQAAEREAVRLAAVNQTEHGYAMFMSHELRGPLNALLSMVEGLHQSGLSRDQQARVDTIRTTGRVLLGLVDSTLDLSRLDSGQQTLRREAVDLRGVIEEVVALFEPQARWKRLVLWPKIDVGVPSLIAGDRGRLKEVLINLVANAVNHATGGEVVIEALPAGDGRLAVIVRDAGQGGTSPALGRFLRRVSGGTTASATPSEIRDELGLGLLIARRLTELMKGELRCDRPPGPGGQFALLLQAVEWNSASAPMRRRGEDGDGI